ncbi:MAG: 50S ribosomal protein L1 [Candidatus Falkowbacteria bacterium]
MTKEPTSAKATADKKKQKNPAAEYDKSKAYSITEAVELSKKLSKTKFDASMEIHFRLGIDIKKGEQQVRLAVSLPNGTGKTIKVAAFVTPAKEEDVRRAGADYVGGEELINEIKKTEKTDFQVAVAEPAMMKNLASIAKILGTRGLMPSPKNETVTPNPAKAVEELKKGKVSLKNDDTGNVHVAIGKVSFETEKLVQNFETLLEAIRKAKPATSKGIYIKNAYISSTMGPGLKLAL